MMPPRSLSPGSQRNSCPGMLIGDRHRRARLPQVLDTLERLVLLDHFEYWLPHRRGYVSVCAGDRRGNRSSKLCQNCVTYPRSSHQRLRATLSAAVNPGGLTLADGWTFMIRIDLPAPPGLGKAYKS